MAALTSQQRFDVRVDLSSTISARREAFPLSKAGLDAAIAAADDWIDLNQSAYNLALPLAARTNLTTAQKTELFTIVARKRLSG